MIVGPVENPSHHRNFCPVARFYAAVEAARVSVPVRTHQYGAGIIRAALISIPIWIAIIWTIAHLARKAGLL
jgi:hypothetical protein